MLLQVMTTNTVEAWHHSLKTNAGGKEVMETFSFSGFVSYVYIIGNQWEQRAIVLKVLWFKTYVPECSDYPELAKFPGPVDCGPA